MSSRMGDADTCRHGPHPHYGLREDTPRGQVGQACIIPADPYTQVVLKERLSLPCSNPVRFK